MKIFTTPQIRQLDLQTIEHEPISSTDLMERAADRILTQFKTDFGLNYQVLILAGPGNNGGDGLALGRMLLQVGYEVQVVLLHSGKLSPDCQLNKERILKYFPDFIAEQKDNFTPLTITKETLIIDALFGSGLSRPLEGIYKQAVEWINSTENTVISIDIPSGLDGDKCAEQDVAIIKSHLTYTLQFPKLAFFFAENESFIGDWKVIDIQLNTDAVQEMTTPYNLIEAAEVISILKERKLFSHKGFFGHALIWGGKQGMAGATVLALKACLRSGAGLVTIHSVEENRVILQTAVPEAIFTDNLNSLTNYTTFAFGPGLGTDKTTADTLLNLLKSVKEPCVLDADALNIISQHPDFLHFIPKKSILTPHPKEFERLFGSSSNSLERMKTASLKASELGIIIVLKGAHTIIAMPNGQIFFNSSGNPGMAVGGMGDVLTGIITGLMAQKHTPEESALLGVFLHGLAGDLALSEQSVESLLPSDVIKKLGFAFNFLKN